MNSGQLQPFQRAYAIGETTEVDLDYGKIRVVIDGFKELCFDFTESLRETKLVYGGGLFISFNTLLYYW